MAGTQHSEPARCIVVLCILRRRALSVAQWPWPRRTACVCVLSHVCADNMRMKSNLLLVLPCYSHTKVGARVLLVALGLKCTASARQGHDSAT